MFDNLSPLTQLILVFVGLAILFLIIVANSKRNKNKREKFSSRNFKANIREKQQKKDKSK